MLEAKRTGYRGTKDKYLRITPEGCLNLNDMLLIGRQQKEKKNLSVMGKKELREFVRCKYEERELLIDGITGSIYDANTGQGSSPLLHISIPKKKKK